MLLLIGALLVIGAAVFPTRSGSDSSNCGGNSAALAQVQSIVDLGRACALGAPDHSFRFSAADAERREELSHYARSHWLRSARFLVSTAPVMAQETQPKRIVVVCDTAYRNVPRQWIGSAEPSHAAGFSDGSHGLISPAEFAALDRSTFTPLDELYPSNSK